MEKSYSINIIAIVILSAMTILLTILTLNMMDKHMYPGVSVIKQDGNVLFLELDDELTIGTDMMCLRAAQVLKNIAEETRLYIQVVPKEQGGWVPFHGETMSYLDLVNIIESGMPY